MATRESLCPGYKYVTSFSRELEEDYEEETMYVTLDMGVVEATLVPNSSTYRLIGLDTPTPYLQLSGSIFKGAQETLLGNEILFTEGTDEQDRAKRFVVPSAVAAEERIKFREVFLEERTVETERREEEGREKEIRKDARSMKSRITKSTGGRGGGSPSKWGRGRGRGRGRGGGRGGGKGKGKERTPDDEEDDDEYVDDE